MSTYRIKGDDGVVIESTKYLELPKGTDSGRPEKPRPGMIRYNEHVDHRGIEASVIVETSGEKSLEWRRVAHLDKDGRLLTSQLPSSITGSLTYKGTWDAAVNDVNETAADIDPPLDPLPLAAGRTGHYYIVRVDGNGNGANNLGFVPSGTGAKYQKGDWIVSNGSEWEKVDHSQISSTASQTQLSTTSMRDKLSVKDSVSLQDAMDGIVENALDRFGDTIRGTISVSGSDADARILLANGSAAKPNLSFVSDSKSGIFRDAASTISFATNGVKRLDLNTTALISTVLVKGPDGTPSTPTFTFASNDNTGIFKADANVIGMSTSGVERARVYERGVSALAYAAERKSAADVSYAFKDDLTTGIYSPAEGQTAIASNTSTVANFKSNEIVTIVPSRTSNGTAAAPAYSFSSDTKSGMFLSKVGFVNISAFGKDVLELSNEVTTSRNTTRFLDGTLALPSISFTSDPDSGFIRSAENTIDVVTAGTSVMSYGATSVTMKGALLVTDGTVAAPGLAFASDPDTGIYKSAANTLSITAGGKLGLTVDPTQKVTFASKATFPLASAAAPSIVFNNQNSGLFGATNEVGISTAGIERLSVTNTDVTVNNRLLVPVGTAATPSVIFGVTSTAGLYAPNPNEVGIASAGTANMRFTPTTNVSDVQLLVSEGTVATPGIAFKSEVNSGMFLSTAKTVSIAASGAEVLQIQPDYVNPLKPVKLINGAVAAPSLCFDANVKTGLYSASGNIYATINGANRFAIANTGVTSYVPFILGTNKFDMGKGSIQTSADGSMSFSGDHAITPFTFGKGVTPYMTITPQGVIVPIGTTAQRIADPTNGTIRYNSDLKNFEGFANGAWAELAGSGKINDSGSATAPAITLGSSSNTGIYSDAANTVSISAGGEKQMTISTSGALFTKPVEINTNSGSLKIGSQNTSWTHFNADKPFYFNKRTEAEGGFKVFNKDTALQADGNIMENGKLLQDKYVLIDPIALVGSSPTGTKNIRMDADSCVFWSKATDYARIAFVHDGVDSSTNNHMLFETGDNSNEYFKFAHRVSSSPSNITWMDVKGTGIEVTGKNSTLGDWDITPSGIKFNNTDVITIDGTGKVTVNGETSGAGSGLPATGGTLTGALELATPYPQIVFNETDAKKKYILVSDGTGIRLNEDTTVGKHIWGYDSTIGAFEMYKPAAHWSAGMGTTANSLTTKEYVDARVLKAGDTMTGLLNINMNSASSKALSLNNTTDGWTYFQMGHPSTVAKSAHIAWNTTASDNAIANSFHIRPGAASTAFSVAVDSVRSHQTHYMLDNMSVTNAAPYMELHKPGSIAGMFHTQGTQGIVLSQTSGNGVAAGSGAHTSWNLTNGTTLKSAQAWTNAMSHSYSAQHGQWSPLSVDFGAGAGASDYYPALKARQVVNAQGYTTDAEFGMLRSGANSWGQAVIRVGSGEAGTQAIQSSFLFDVGGLFVAPGGVNAGPGGFTSTGNIRLNNAAPTITLQDTDNLPAMLHNNSNLFYVLRGGSPNAEGWDGGPNGRHPMTLNLATGDVVFSGNVTAYSDIRLKKEVKDLENPLEKVLQLRGVNYKRIGTDTDRVECGFVAQELQKVIPEVVIEQQDEDKTLTVDYAKMNAYLVEAIKEQQKMINDLRDEIEKLKK